MRLRRQLRITQTVALISIASAAALAYCQYRTTRLIQSAWINIDQLDQALALESRITQDNTGRIISIEHRLQPLDGQPPPCRGLYC